MGTARLAELAALGAGLLTSPKPRTAGLLEFGRPTVTTSAGSETRAPRANRVCGG